MFKLLIDENKKCVDCVSKVDEVIAQYIEFMPEKCCTQTDENILRNKYFGRVSCDKHCNECKLLSFRHLPRKCYYHSEEEFIAKNFIEQFMYDGYYFPYQLQEYNNMVLLENKYCEDTGNILGGLKSKFLTRTDCVEMFDKDNLKIITNIRNKEIRLNNAKTYYEKNKDKIKQKKREKYNEQKNHTQKCED